MSKAVLAATVALAWGLGAILPPEAVAQSQALSRFGEQDCSRWSDGARRSVNQAWLLAYLAGLNATYNSFAARPHDGRSQLSGPEKAMQWMDGYCRDAPTAKLSTGASLLFLQMIREPAPPAP